MNAASVRDVEQFPQVGDVVQPVPKLAGDPLPPTLTIVAIDDQHVTWTRGGEEFATRRSFWRGDRIHGGSRMRLTLAGAAA